MHGRVVLSVVAMLTAFAGLTMVVPAAVSLAYDEPVWLALLAASAVTTGVGLAAHRWVGRAEEISIRDGFAIVTLGWISVAAFGALPYLLTGAIPSITHALFESMSGLTTTGATIVEDIEGLPRGVVLWRSQTQWLGGMGIIVLSVAILPLLGIGGMQLLQAEIPGLAPDRIRPRVRQTATALWVVYALLTATEAVLLAAGGMGLFDAINHSLTTMATGGFSTSDRSIAAFKSPYVQYVIAVFITLAGINFTLHYSWLTGKWGRVWRNQELRVYLALCAAATVLLTLLVWLPGTIGGLEASFRAGFFQAVSIMTTTGFTTADYELWAPAAQILILLLMLIGGSTGSTAGSVKVLRFMLVAKEARVAMRRLIHPQGVFVFKVEGRPVSDEVLASVSGFLLVYLGTLGLGAFAMTLFGLDVATAVGAVAATLGNVGPGFGLVGPTEIYSGLPAASLWLLSFLMLLGRLELFTVLVLLTRGYWR